LYESVLEIGFCFNCKTKKDLCIHHRDENFMNNSLGNLAILCRSCHSKLHRGMSVVDVSVKHLGGSETLTPQL